MNWKKLSSKEINERIFSALEQNINYRKADILGIPASFLDEEEFYTDAPFLKDSPFLSTLIDNPNHIGCHTLGTSEPFFRGTQQIEKELISLCAENIFEGNKDEQDGYVASGGTEANIQAMWIYRNYYMKEHNALPQEIKIIASEDAHYSMLKASDLLGIDLLSIQVDQENRSILLDDMDKQIQEAKKSGVKYFIIVLNLSTTMFGSVDDIETITNYLNNQKINYKCHVDAAFGGFIYPFTNEKSNYTFQNPAITSFTLDAHKMLQAPYGTGIFLVRKGYMKYVVNAKAQYVAGLDYTLSGSRSGANAIAVWMILMHHGRAGWTYKMQLLIDRTDKVCSHLDKLNIKYTRNPYINIVAIRAEDISENLAKKYHLVPDTHDNSPGWWKIVMMDHVRKGSIDSFLLALQSERHEKSN